MTTLRDKGCKSLFVVGAIGLAGNLSVGNIARWRARPLCYAHCDGSTAAPVLNVLDFTCYMGRFAAGCP